MFFISSNVVRGTRRLAEAFLSQAAVALRSNCADLHSLFL